MAGRDARHTAGTTARQAGKLNRDFLESAGWESLIARTQRF
jgi:hypothetical protein